MELSAVAILCCAFVAAQARESMIELSQEWKPEFGWEVVCSWHLPVNDSLQSLRLSGPDPQYMSYRPEYDGPDRSGLMRLPTMEFRYHCQLTQESGRTGKCTTALEIMQPVTEDIRYTCEVSGERPQFRTEEKTIVIEALVGPSDAAIERIGDRASTATDPSSERVSVNCTSTGLPAPKLVWTIGDQKIPEDFSGVSWNFTSKLYHVWSSISYTPVDSSSHAVCTPETVRAGQLVKGKPSLFNSAGSLKGITTLYWCLFLILSSTR